MARNKRITKRHVVSAGVKIKREGPAVTPAAVAVVTLRSATNHYPTTGTTRTSSSADIRQATPVPFVEAGTDKSPSLTLLVDASGTPMRSTPLGPVVSQSKEGRNPSSSSSSSTSTTTSLLNRSVSPTTTSARSPTSSVTSGSSASSTSATLGARANKLMGLYDKLNVITVEIEELQASTRLKALYDQANAITAEAADLHTRIQNDNLILQQNSSDHRDL